MNPKSTELTFQELAHGETLLTARQWIPRPLELTFEFFSRPENLESLTPDLLRFRIVTPGPLEMRNGLEIDYRLRMSGLPMRWRSRIENYQPPHVFTDIQIRGPYRKWEHTHTFQEEDGGTRILDEVRYRNPGGRWVERWLIRPRLRTIFSYRQQVLKDLLDSGS